MPWGFEILESKSMAMIGWIGVVLRFTPRGRMLERFYLGTYSMSVGEHKLYVE